MHRKSYSRTSKAFDSVSAWNTTNARVTNLLASVFFEKLGITDIPSYFQKLGSVVVVSVVVCSVAGAYRSGLSGFLLWGIAGIAVPAAAIWLAAALCYVAVYLAVVLAVWALLFYGVLWLLSF